MSRNRLWQVAWSVSDLERMTRFYRIALGLSDGGRTRLFRGPLASRVQGLQRAASTCHWLYPPDQHLQLEFFAFEPPNAPRSREGGPQITDIGYARVTFEVRDFDTACTRLDSLEAAVLGAAATADGRRVRAYRDPEGNALVVEERPGLTVAARVAGVGLNVSDLERSTRNLSAGLALEPLKPDSGLELGALLGQPTADLSAVRLCAGDTWLELTEFRDPPSRRRPRDYKLSDRGLLNIAFGFRERSEFLRAHTRALRAGFSDVGRPLMLGLADVVYMEDPDGISVELMRIHRYLDRAVGFAPRYRWLP